jgi:chromate transporter
VDGVTAAATGALAGAVIVLARRALVDVPTWSLFAVALCLLLFVKKLPEPVLILGAGIAGVAVRGAVA